VDVPEFNPLEAELPAPSAELVLWRTSVQCFLAVSGRKRADRFLRMMADRLAQEDNLSSVFQIRPQSELSNVRIARKQAAAIFERYMPIFLAQLPDD
jgi:hypothetical protein